MSGATATGSLIVHTETASGGISFGTPAQSTLPPGGMLQMSGAAVQAAAGIYWVATIVAVDDAGARLGQTQLEGQGPQSGLSYQIGPLNAVATGVHLGGTLQEYSDAAHTQMLAGGPITGSSADVATLANYPAPTAAPVLTATVNQSTGQVSLSWTAIAGAGAYEIQPAAGVPWVGGTETYDAGGGIGFFTQATSAVATLAAGTTLAVQVRAATGIGPTAQVGPWSNAVTVAVTGTPELVVQGLSASASTPTVGGPTGTWGPGTISGPWPTVSLAGAIANLGSAPGNAPGWSAAIVDSTGRVWGVAGFSGLIPVAVGASVPFRATVQLGNLGVGLMPPAGTYTVYAALGQGYQSAGYSGNGQPFQGVVAGSVSTTVQVP